jgi:hypothetical protein
MARAAAMVLFTNTRRFDIGGVLKNKSILGFGMVIL